MTKMVGLIFSSTIQITVTKTDYNLGDAVIIKIYHLNNIVIFICCGFPLFTPFERLLISRCRFKFCLVHHLSTHSGKYKE
jgi:hypothetical protein